MKRKPTSRIGASVERRPDGLKLKAIVGSGVVAAVSMVQMLGRASNEGDEALDIFFGLLPDSNSTIEQKCPLSVQQPIVICDR